ncbi:MAG: hypothetical protein HOO96_38620 [Polyangiaceae bacterium]|nr:hypothetical protein [Polyangiaceae bacterium]
MGKKKATKATRAVLNLARPHRSHNTSQALFTSFCEAAAVVLSWFHVVPPPATITRIRSEGKQFAVDLAWKEPTLQVRLAHGNDTDAIEYGAYAVAGLCLHHVHRWKLLGRTQTASGADFFIIPEGAPAEEFVRIEVSGIAKNSGVTELERRLRTKIKQLAHGDLARPGVAVVVGFKTAHVLISEIQK